MDARSYVDKAREMASELEDRETAAVGSRPVARRRLARVSGVPLSVLHSLRYRPPKTISADVFDKLCAAIERQAEQQIRILQDAICEARSRRSGVDNNSVREAASSLEHARQLLRKDG